MLEISAEDAHKLIFTLDPQNSTLIDTGIFLNMVFDQNIGKRWNNTILKQQN